MHDALPDGDIITLAYVVTSFILLLLCAIIVLLMMLMQKRKRSFELESTLLKKSYEEAMLQSQIEVQETTMTSLSRELHDNIGQMLSTAKMLMGLTEQQMETMPDTFKTASDVVANTIIEIRSLSKTLSTDWLEQFSFSDNLEREIARLKLSDQLSIEADIQPAFISPQRQIILFRIVQECLQNCVKHASAKKLAVKVHTNELDLVICVSDDGHGFTTDNSSDGLGITNIKKRTRLLGGIVSWESANSGTTVTLRIPLEL